MRNSTSKEIDDLKNATLTPPPPNVNTNTGTQNKNMKKRPGATLPPQTVAGTPEPEKATTVLSTILQWLFILGIIAGIYFLGKYASIKLPELNLKPYQVVILSFSFAFTWVYIFKWGNIKPFNCVTCMSGWFALIIGYWCFHWWGIALMPVAMTVAALYSEIRMRWL